MSDSTSYLVESARAMVDNNRTRWPASDLQVIKQLADEVEFLRARLNEWSGV